jgi:hypothetical protein
MEQSMRSLMIAAYLGLLSVSGCTSVKTASTGTPTAGAQTAVPSDSRSIPPQPTVAPPRQPAGSSAADIGRSSSAAVENPAAAAVPQSAGPAAGATPAKSKSPTGEHPINQAGEAAPLRPPAVSATAQNKPAAPPTLNLAELEQRLRDTRAIGVFTKLSLKNQVDDLLAEFRTLYKGADKHPTAELRQQYDLLLLKVLSLLQDSDPSLAAAISSSREAIWGILSDPNKFAAI